MRDPAPDPQPAPRAAEDAHAACQADLEQLRESYRRLAADFDNHRKRQHREAQRAVARDRDALLLDVLGVIDDLERALDASHEAPAEALRDGLEGVVREARHLLSVRGVTRMEAIGAAFDPERHEAVGLAEEGLDGQVHSEVRPGYLIGGEVLRPAEVMVGKGGRR